MDVVADTFAIAWQRLDDIPCGPGSLLWLYATARNVLANHYRGLQRRSALVERLGKDLDRLGTLQDALDEDVLSARAALGSLSEDEQEILMLAGWEGLNSSDLGKVLGCSSVAARIRLCRARAQLVAKQAGPKLASKQQPGIGHLPSEAAAE